MNALDVVVEQVAALFGGPVQPHASGLGVLVVWWWEGAEEGGGGGRSCEGADSNWVRCCTKRWSLAGIRLKAAVVGRMSIGPPSGRGSVSARRPRLSAALASRAIRGWGAQVAERFPASIGCGFTQHEFRPVWCINFAAMMGFQYFDVPIVT